MKKKLLLLAVLSVVNLTASADVEINETNFPDEIFRNWVSRYYGSDGVLTDEKVAGAERIYLAGLGIQSLKGIEYFTALTELTCYDNQLTVLDVSECTVLSELYCYNNMLATLNVSGCLALKKLDCHSNQLPALDVSECTALTTLDCYYNQLTALDISGCTALKMLNCGINQLTTLDVSKNTSLKELYCGSNQLTTLDVSKNTALTELSCNVNPLTTLDLSGCTALTTLRCHSCQFTTLDVSGCTALTGLDCTLNNQLTTLDLSNNTALTWLWCSYNNQLTTLDLSKNTALVTLVCENNQLTTLNVSGCTALTSINCSGNQLTTLDVSNTAVGTLICYKNQIKGTGMDTLVESLPIANWYGYMQVIWYENEQNEMTTEQVAVARAKGWVPFCLVNELWTEYDGVEPTAHVEINETNFPDPNFRNWVLSQDYGADGVLTDAEIANVKEIDVQSMAIQSLKGIEYFTALATLECNFNQLTALDVSKNTALVWLDCSANQLTTLDVSKNTALTALLCNVNQLTVLDVSKNTALTHLFCADNQLTALDVSQNTALTTLYCDNNHLTALDLSKNTALITLGCHSNQLTTLDLSQNASLTELVIWHNQIRGAAMDALVGSLPTVTVSLATMLVIQGGSEQNEMTTTQVAAAKAKGWIPYADDGSGWQPYAGSEPTYRPFVEEGKLWVINVSADVDGETTLRWIDYCYLEGDTIIDGQTCKKMRYITNVNEENWVNGVLTPATSIQGYIGAFYEQDKKVFFARNGKQQFELLYDFTLSTDDTIDVGGSLFTVKKMSGGITGFKGTYYDLWHYDQFIERWLQGVGSESWPYVNDPWLVDGARGILLACSVDDEVIYCNSNMEYPYIMGAQRQRFDFTHTIKSQPKAPMGTLATLPAEAEQSLYGEYNDLQLGINLDSLDETYLVHITDKSGKVVYEKTINADNIVGLNIDISNYAEGRYTVTVENNYESFVGEFDTQTTGIKENARIEKLKNESIYNLQGQRIKTLQKGLNIVNGRKVYVK